jgi:hypothetical protein
VVAREPESTSEPPHATDAQPEGRERQFDWSVPSCPLTYHYRARLGNDSSAMIIEFDIIMSARGAGVSLHSREIQISQILDNKPFGKGMVEPEGSLADVHLERGDGVWTEVDGITKLWSAFDSAPALMLMWPALPAQRTPGATASWMVTGNHDNPDVVRTEFARSSEELPDDWEPDEYEQPPATSNTVTLESWERDGVTSKAILVMDETHPLSIPGGEVQASTRLVGRYEVLDSGRLVRAEVTIEFRDERTTIASSAEFSLTDGCDAAETTHDDDGQTGGEQPPHVKTKPAPVKKPKQTSSTREIDCVRSCVKSNPIAELDKAAARADCEQTCREK